ncbi:unnamed protein product [Effrenium voratum]|nr:unnamed protein product [Effrenium voratum]
MPPPLQSCCERAGYSCSGRIFDWIVIIQVQGSVPQSPACSCFVFRRSLPPTYIMMLSFVLRLLCALLLFPVSTATRELQTDLKEAEDQHHMDTAELTDDRQGDSSSANR